MSPHRGSVSPLAGSVVAVAGRGRRSTSPRALIVAVVESMKMEHEVRAATAAR